MQLRIRIRTNNKLHGERDRIMGSFHDLDRLATEVARDVKLWVRQVPLRKQASSYGLAVTAEWVEPVAPKKKR